MEDVRGRAHTEIQTTKVKNRISHEISSEAIGADSNGIVRAIYEMPEKTIISTVNGKSKELKTIATARKNLLVWF